ncbi:hypothetical protein [Mycoplasmopsis gallinacea]|uniref:hypothetical protein n=1 Tax=Mycoplasmopsis gallinacea TaxID=29556 RepID=UPI00101DD941|nr:hypothetical protein [Mycoplasmopsis gallinacea]
MIALSLITLSNLWLSVKVLKVAVLTLVETISSKLALFDLILYWTVNAPVLSLIEFGRILTS